MSSRFLFLRSFLLLATAAWLAAPARAQELSFQAGTTGLGLALSSHYSW